MDTTLKRITAPGVVISVVIPCYNSGEYLPDAIRSVQEHPDKSVYEIIVVNDGSTDEQTIVLLNELEREGVTVIHQENKGPAAARNSGVKIASGRYILFLDSDNMIVKDYLDQSIAILDTNPAVSIVYGNNFFFGGDETKKFRSKPFNLTKILSQNYIDMCSVVRKSVLEELNGLDESRTIIGHEDWELWIRVGALGYRFHFIDHELFYYRLRPDSLLIQMSKSDKLEKMLKYIYSKHANVVNDCLKEAVRNEEAILQMYQYDQNRPLRSFLKFFCKKYLRQK